MTTELAERPCVPCRGGVPALKGDDLQRLLRELGHGWTAIQEHHLEKTYRFKNFREALAFTNAVGAIAEGEGHHPEITLAWGKAILRIWTHASDGLTDNDFILAAKADRAYTPPPAKPPA